MRKDVNIISDKKIKLDYDVIKTEMDNKDGFGKGKNNSYVLSDLAEEIGHDYSYLCRVIHGPITRKLAEKIAKAFGVSVEYLAGIVPYRNEEERLNSLNSLRTKEDKERFSKALDYYNSIPGVKIEMISKDSKGYPCATPFSVNDIGIYDGVEFDEVKDENGEIIRTYFEITYYYDDLKEFITKCHSVSETISFVLKMEMTTENTIKLFF